MVTIFLSLVDYFARGRRQSITVIVSVSVCSCVLSMRISQKLLVQTSPISLYILPVAVLVRSFTDGNAIRYVLPVLWMTSCFQIMERMGQNQRRPTLRFRRVRQLAPAASKSLSTIADLLASCGSLASAAPVRVRQKKLRSSLLCARAPG